MKQKTCAISIFSYCEILSRFVSLTAPVIGTSNFPVEIRFEADNATEPPVVTLYIIDSPGRKSGTLCYEYVDQNTTLQEFLDVCNRISRTVSICVEAAASQRTYAEVLAEKYAAGRDKATDGTDDLPF